MYNKRDLEPYIRSELHRHTDWGCKSVSVRSCHVLGTARKHRSLFCGYPEAFITVHTTDNSRFAIHDVTYTELKFKGGTC